MASRSKNKTTFAKLAREGRLRERRAEKQARKEARKRAAENPVPQADDVPYPDDVRQPDDASLREDGDSGVAGSLDDA
jgi:hypothetical protein